MQAALVDSNVLITATNRDVDRHELSLDILSGADHGELPELRVLDYVLAETVNFVAERIGRSEALDLYDRVDRSSGFEFVQTTRRDDRAAIEQCRSSSVLSFVDAALGAYADRSGLEYCYSFDDDIDALEGLARLDRPVDPFEPK